MTRKIKKPFPITYVWPIAKGSQSPLHMDAIISLQPNSIMESLRRYEVIATFPHGVSIKTGEERSCFLKQEE